MYSKIALCFCLLWSCLIVSGQGKVDVARNEWMKGYVKLESADKADEADNKLMALQLYRDTMSVFEEVRRKYPQWNPSLLNYRINYCKQKISKLEENMKNDAQSMSRERLLQLIAKQTQIIHENSLQIQQLTTSVSVLSESLQRARTEAAQKSASESEFSSLQKARQELESRCQLLQNKLSKAEEDTANLQKQVEDKQVTRKLREGLEQSQAQLKEATRQIEQLQGNLTATRADLAKKAQENERLLRNSKEYESRLDLASKRVAELTAMLNDFNLKNQVLTLKSEQQAVENKLAKDTVKRLEDEKNDLQNEIKQLQVVRNKFALAQDAKQKLTLQITDYENRLQESAEKLKFESKNSAQQMEQQRVELLALRESLLSAKKDLLAAQKESKDQAALVLASNQDNQRLGEDLATLKIESEQQRQEFQAGRETAERLANELAEAKRINQQQKSELAAVRKNSQQQANELQQKNSSLVEAEQNTQKLQNDLKKLPALLEEQEKIILATRKERDNALAQLLASASKQDGQPQNGDSIALKAVVEQQHQDLLAARETTERLTTELAETRRTNQRLQQEVSSQRGAEQNEEKLRSDLQKLQGLLEEQEKIIVATRQERDKALAELKQNNPEVARLQLFLTNSKNELARKHSELDLALTESNKFKQELLQAENKLMALQQKINEPPSVSVEAQRLATLTQELQSSQSNANTLTAELRGTTADLQEKSESLRQSQNYALKLEGQIKQLRESQNEFANIVKQLQNKDEALSSKNTEIQNQAERLASVNAVILAKTDELTSTKTELQALKRKLSNLEVTNDRLLEQVTNFTRRQTETEKIAAEWQMQMQTNSKQQEELQRQLQAAKVELEARNQLTIKLEQLASKNEQQVKLLEQRLADGDKKLSLLQEELGSSKTKTAAVDGLTSNLLDLQNSLAAKMREVKTLQVEQQAKQTQLSVLSEQLRRKDEQFKELLSSNDAKSERIWMSRLAELNAKLENEENRRKALEVILIQKESEGQKEPTTELLASTTTTAGKESAALKPGKFLAEQEVLVNGFLRQALDAEKKQKVEAAQWNYHKALELQPANLMALKRLGLLASNSGNYEDTSKYLKLAFRYDPDDLDVLVALGFAMLNLGQTEWAFSFLGRAVALAPDNATTARLFGGALVDLGWTQAAESQFKKTLEINPKDAHSAFNLAVLCLTANPQRLTEARKWYEQAVANGAEKDSKFETAFLNKP